MSRFLANKSSMQSQLHSTHLQSFEANELQKTTNTKLDTALVQHTATNTKLDNLSGAINNNIGDGTVKLQVYPYAHDVSNGLSRPLKCDSAGRLECSVDALEITADTINLSTNELEAKVDAVTSKLDTFAGAGNNNIGEGSAKLQTYLYARDVSAGNFKPLVCDGDAHLQIDCLSSALPSGAATEAKQDSGITHLATIAGDTTSLDSKVTACNTGAVVISSSALPSGAATAAHQATQNTALSEIEGAVENLELTVGANTATAPTRSLQIGGKYVDGTFRDIKVDNIGKVIIDTPTGSDIDVRLAAIQTAVEILDNAITGNEMQVDVVTMPTTAVTLAGGATEAKQDVQETTLNAIQSAVEGTLTVGSHAVTNAGTFATQVDGAALTALQLIDDAIVIDDAAVTLGSQKGVAIMGFAGTQSVNANDAAMLTCSTAGRLEVDVKNTVSQAVTNAGTFATQVDGAALTALQLIDDAVVIDDAAVTLGSQKGMAMMGFAGTQSVDANDACMLACSTAGRLEVDVKNTVSQAVTNAGTFATQVDGAALTALQLIDDAVVIDDAAVTLGSQKGMAMMGFAGTQSVDANDACMLACSTAGRLEVDIKNTVSTAVTHDGLTAIDNAIGTDGSTGPSKCMSIGGTNPLSGNIQEIAVDSAGHLSVDILTSAIPSGASTELSLAVVKTKATLATSAEIKELLSGITVNAGALSSEFDTENYERIRFFGESTASVGTDIVLMGSNESGGTFYILGENLRSETIGSTHYVYGAGTENLPRFIKLLNKSGSSNYIFTKLYMQLSGGRLLV